MSDAELRDLAAAYALGALEPDEARAFERLLESSPELAREVDELREVGGLLVSGVPAVHPDPAFRSRVLDRVAREREAVSPRSAGAVWLPRLAWAAAAAGIVGAVLLAQQRREMGARLATLERQRDSLTGELASQRETLDAILGATTQFRLTSPGDPQPGLQVFWNRPSNVWVLHAVALQPAPPGRVYQLWFLRGGEAIPASTFNSRADGELVVTVPGPADRVGLTGAAITEEPIGGSPQPTSTPILVGSVEPQ